MHLRVIGSLWVGVSVALSAQEPFTFDAALERAMARHPGLQVLEARGRAAEARTIGAGVLPDPRAGVTVFGESVQTRTGPQEAVYSLSQDVPWFGTLDERVRAARAGSEAAVQAVEAARLRVRRDLAEVFYELGYVDHAMELTGENLRLLEELEPVVRTNVEGGGDLNALLRLKVETGRLADTRASLGKRRQVLNARLRAMLDLEPGVPVQSPAWEAPAWESDVSDDLSGVSDHTPELARLRAELAAARGREELARLEGYPSFRLGANYIQTGERAGTPDAGADPWNVMVAVRIPLWRDRIRAEREEAGAEVRQADRALAWKRNQLRAELETALASRADALRRLNLFGEELLDLAEQAVENSRAAYEAGRAGILEVIDSERSRLDLQQLYWRAAADAHIHRVIMENLTMDTPSPETEKF